MNAVAMPTIGDYDLQMGIVTWAVYTAGLRVYFDGKHIATVPRHKLKYLLADVAKDLAHDETQTTDKPK